MFTIEIEDGREVHTWVTDTKFKYFSLRNYRKQKTKTLISHKAPLENYNIFNLSSHTYALNQN